MNYFKQVAEMLGMELEEEFRLKNNHKNLISRTRYKITQEKGLMCKQERREWEWASDALIVSIVNGTYSVVKLPWKPKVGRDYWYYNAQTENPYKKEWNGGYYDLLRWKAGNCFRTREEASIEGKGNIEQIQKEFEEA